MKYCPYCGSPLMRLPVSGRERLACPDGQCGFVHWDNPVPVVAAIVEHDDHVVLVRNVGWPQHWYGLVTGFLESGEMPEEGIAREIEEEFAVEVAKLREQAKEKLFSNLNKAQQRKLSEILGEEFTLSEARQGNVLRINSSVLSGKQNPAGNSQGKGK